MLGNFDPTPLSIELPLLLPLFLCGSASRSGNFHRISDSPSTGLIPRPWPGLGADLEMYGFERLISRSNAFSLLLMEEIDERTDSNS